ncbi:MAG: DUF3108 domain-containing protein [Muribaculaceae bacterium]|nr:DUF3108 domain-containing protein [Muribaculaceae bacterium]
MKRTFLLILISVLLGPLAAGAQTATPTLSDETLTYDVIYKWGFINKVAGYATMTLRSDGNFYRASLYAENAPWANSIYMLRDTLYTTMTHQGLYPTQYTLIAHENGKYKKDILTFNHNGDIFTAEVVRYRRAAKSDKTEKSETELEATGMTVDMLSAFFYLRAMDFDSMTAGDSKTLNIFSGAKKELLKIIYKGRQTMNLNGSKFDTYLINFTFTSHGKQSSAPISAWITTDARRIPLKVEGKLSVGKVRALYTGPNP